MPNPFVISVPDPLTDKSLVPFFRGWQWHDDVPPKSVIIDFSRSTFAAPWVAAMFGAYACWLRSSQGREVKLWLDEDSQVGYFLKRARLPHLLGEETEDVGVSTADRIFPLTQIHKSKEIQPCVNELMRLLAIEDTEIADAIRYSLVELLRNVVQHAYSDIGAVVLGNYYPKVGQVDIVVADFGRGIRVALQERYHEIKDDYKAVKFALQPHISGTFAHGAYESMASNAGLGLFFIREIAARSGGGFFLGSGSMLAAIRGSEDGVPQKRYYTSKSDGWRGTVAVLQLKRGHIEEFESLLKRCREIAAEVRRDPTELKLDFIDEVPDLEELLVVGVKSFEEDVEVADQVREEKIIPALESGTLVVLNFSGIRAATQSFAHALLYRVFRDGRNTETSLSIACADNATQEAIRAVTAYARVSEDSQGSGR